MKEISINIRGLIVDKLVKDATGEEECCIVCTREDAAYLQNLPGFMACADGGYKFRGFDLHLIN